MQWLIQLEAALFIFLLNHKSLASLIPQEKTPIPRPNIFLPNPRITKYKGNTYIVELPLPRAILRGVMLHVRDRGIYNLFNGTDGQTSELWVQTALRKKCKSVFCFVFWWRQTGKERVIIKQG